MLSAMGVSDPASVESVRYRGNGWPGRATVRYRTPHGTEERSLSYDESWGDILQKHRQWRCYICPDHTGEAADISVGDPWYRPIPEGDPGHSLVLARTERGKRIIEEAIKAGYLTLRRVEPRILPASQPNLLRTRGAVWGRLLALRLAGAPTPIYRGMEMLRFWLTELSLKDKLQSLTGTLRRIGRKKLKERQPVVPFEPARSCAQGAQCAGGGAHG
jgi:coenzyme F420 hydrogenase subunit beta